MLANLVGGMDVNQTEIETNTLPSRSSNRSKRPPASKEAGGTTQPSTQQSTKKGKHTSIPKPIAEAKTLRSSTPKFAKKGVKSPLNNTVSKMFQQLAAINCYRIVTELNSMKTDNLNRAIEQYFHGTEGRKTVGQIQQLVEGSHRGVHSLMGLVFIWRRQDNKH